MPTLVIYGSFSRMDHFLSPIILLFLARERYYEGFRRDAWPLPSPLWPLDSLIHVRTMVSTTGEERWCLSSAQYVSVPLLGDSACVVLFDLTRTITVVRQR